MLRKSQHMDAYRVYLWYIFVTSLAFALVWTLNMVYQVREVGLDPFQLVLVGTVLELTAFVFEVPTGVVADVYSRRLSTILGVIFLGVGFIIMGAVPVFGVLLFSQVIAAIGYTFISGASTAWLTDEIGEEAAGKAFLRASQVGQIGGIAGIVLSVALASFVLALPIVAGGSLFLATAVFLALMMPENGFAPTPKEQRETWRQMQVTLLDGARTIRRRPVLLTIMATVFVFGAFSEGLDRLWTYHMLENFTLPGLGRVSEPVWFGLIAIVSSVIGTGVVEFVRRRVNTSNSRSIARALLVINGLLIGAIIAFAWAQHFALALAAFWVIGPLRGLRHPLEMTWINQGLDSRVRATVLSMTAQMDAIGQIAGGPGVGYVGRVYGVRTALALSGLLLAPTLALYGRTLRLEAGVTVPALAADVPASGE